MSKIVERRLDTIIDFSLSKTNHSQFTKSFIDSHKGSVPVYGASLVEDEASYGYVADNIPGVKYFDDCLTWNIDGSTAIYYREGHFTLSEKVIPLIPFEQIRQSIDLFFLRFAIMFSPGFSTFDFSHKAGKGKLRELLVLMPMDENDTYNLEEQKRLAGIYSEIESQKQILIKRLYEIDELLIHIDRETDVNYEDIPLNIMATHTNGDASYTKTWCQEHKGTYPLYSANNLEPAAYIDSYDYDGEYLTYSKNGCAGYITIMKGRFSVSGDRCVIAINDQYASVIDLLYLKYYLEPIFRKNKKGRLGAFGKNEFTKLNSTMIKGLNILVPVPLTCDGSYDLKKQKEIAEKYKQIDKIKQGLRDKIGYLLSINIVPEILEE